MKGLKWFASSLAIIAALIAALFLGTPMFTGSLVGLQEAGQEAGQEAEYEPTEPILAREPAVAGTFYPNNANELRSMVREYMDDAGNAQNTNNPNIRGIVSPHAGYIYSGPTAAFGFARLNQLKDDYDTVMVIGPSHNFGFEGASIPNATHYKTPLGLVRLSDKAKLIRQEPLFLISDNRIHAPEHSVEVQIPFLQEQLSGEGSDSGPAFEIIPVVTGTVHPAELADVLLKHIDGRTLVIASSDLSHYHPYDTAVELDSACTDSVPGLNLQKTADSCEACGKIPVLALMYMAVKRGWEGQLLDYRNSGDTAGGKEAVVGYMSVAFYGPNTQDDETLSEEEQRFLLGLARNTLDSYLSGQTMPDVDESRLTPALKRTTGCFVTLTKKGQLRGCIGHILPQTPLYQCVIQNAVSAALHDERFRPVSLAESKECKIDISVLTPPERLDFDSSIDLLDKIRPGVDGLVIKYGGRSSTYLPSVWGQIPDKVQFLSQLCIKQGSPSDCWKQPGVVVETYQSFEFHE